jgi:MFS family permease
MQLFALAAVHFVVDMFAGMPPAILPAIRREFALSLSRCGVVLGVLYMTCNGVQVLTGHMRAGKRKPLFLHLGLVLSAAICLLAALPREDGAFGGMILLAVVSGCGIAIVHPEGLRAVHRLGRIPPEVSTAVFMAGGFLGYAGGGGISAFLVSRFGFQGLYPLVICSVAGVAMVMLLGIRLAVERKVPNKSGTQTGKYAVPFWFIVAMAMPAAISTTILASLLPTALEERGFDLTFGGLSATMFGLGGAAGSFVWAYFARRKGELVCTIASLFLALPFLLAYLILMADTTAIWILFGAGFCTISAYTLMITLSRRAAGPTLGQRMGFMVGGTWALAYVVFMALLPAAEYFGANAIFRFVPLGYLLSAVFGLFVMLKTRSSARAGLSGQ